MRHGQIERERKKEIIVYTLLVCCNHKSTHQTIFHGFLCELNKQLIFSSAFRNFTTHNRHIHISFSLATRKYDIFTIYKFYVVNYTTKNINHCCCCCCCCLWWWWRWKNRMYAIWVFFFFSWFFFGVLLCCYRSTNKRREE